MFAQLPATISASLTGAQTVRDAAAGDEGVDQNTGVQHHRHAIRDVRRPAAHRVSLSRSTVAEHRIPRRLVQEQYHRVRKQARQPIHGSERFSRACWRDRFVLGAGGQRRFRAAQQLLDDLSRTARSWRRRKASSERSIAGISDLLQTSNPNQVVLEHIFVLEAESASDPARRWRIICSAFIALVNRSPEKQP